MTKKDLTIDLARLALHWKVLISGFVIILGTGYLAAALNAALAVGISAEAIADHYGDKSLSQEERVMMEQQGFVEEEFSLDDEEEEAVGAGAGMDHGMDHQAMGADMADHGADHDMGGMAMEGHDMGGPVDDSLPPQILVQLAHIHLLGFSLLLLGMGGLFCLTRVSPGMKTLLVGTLALSFLADIAGLNLTRFVSPDFAWMTMIAGTLIGVCLAIMILRVLWELWLMRPAT